MQTYQFETTINDGTIKVPDGCKYKHGAKIIVTINDDNDVDWDDVFPPIADTALWKFNRDEANAR